MENYKTDNTRLKEYYSNMLGQLIRIDTTSIHRFWEVLRFKVEVKTFDLNSSSRKKLFKFFLFLSLYTGASVPVSIKRFLNTEEKKLIRVRSASLSIKDMEEIEEELISLFISQEVKTEMKKVIDDIWDGHIDVDDEEEEQLVKLYENICIFGQNVSWLLKPTK